MKYYILQRKIGNDWVDVTDWHTNYIVLADCLKVYENLYPENDYRIFHDQTKRKY